MPDHGSSAYLSSTARARHRELFRTVRLNAVGWAAVAGLCATGAGIGLVAARLTTASSWITVPAGGAAAFAIVLAADRRKWGGMLTTYFWTDDLAEVEHVASELRHAGVDVVVDTDEFHQPGLQYLNRDHRRVARAFNNAGLPPPPKN